MSASGYLLVTLAETSGLVLIDTQSLETVTPIDVPGRVAVLGVSASGRYGFAIHRDDDQVTIIDGSTGRSLGSVAVESQPTHFHAHRDQIVIFNDGTGSISIFEETALDRGDLTPQHVKVTQPDHGSAVVIDDMVLAGHLRLGRVDVYRLGQPDMLQTFDCCPVLHGAAQVDNIGLFGCGDGVLLVKKQGDELIPVKLDNPPDAPPRVRVGLFATHPATSLVLGNFGQGLSLIDPVDNTLTILSLPHHPLKFAFDASGQAALALTTDGALHHLELSGQVTKSAAVVEAVEPPKGPDGKPRPAFALAHDTLYIVSPQQNVLLQVDAHDFAVQKTVVLAGQPAGIAYLGGK